MPGDGSACLGPRGWLLENATSCNRTLHHVTQASLSCKKISATASPLTSDRLTPQIAIPWIIMWGAVKRKTNKTPCKTYDELKARITVAINKLNKKTVGKACRSF